MLTSTIVPGINYSVVITHPLHQLHARKRSSSRCHMIETIANTWILIMSRQKSKSQNMASEAAHDKFVLFTVKAGNRTPAASEHYKRYTHTPKYLEQTNQTKSTASHKPRFHPRQFQYNSANIPHPMEQKASIITQTESKSSHNSCFNFLSPPITTTIYFTSVWKQSHLP